MQTPTEEKTEVRLWLRYRNWTTSKTTLSLRERANQLKDWLVSNKYQAEVAELMNDNIAIRVYGTPSELNRIVRIIVNIHGFDIVFSNSDLVALRNAPEPGYIPEPEQREGRWTEKAPEFDTWSC